MPEPELQASALRVVAAGDTEIGAREHNEDTVMLRPDLDLYMVADGAGGHNAGNIASALAVTTVAHYFEETLPKAMVAPEYDELGLSTAARRLATAIQDANRAVIEIAKSHQRYQGMGTTIVAAFAEPSRGLMHIAYVGDSRCYRLRGGYLELLTHDHTLINDVLALRPDMPDEQLAKLPRNVITRALGMSESVRVSVRSWEIIPGDRFVLCSDGLTDELDDNAIQSLLDLARAPDEHVKLLLRAANENRANDNIAVVIVACESASGSMESSLPPRTTPRMRSKPKRVPSAPPTAPGSSSEGDDDYPEIIIVGEGITEDSQHAIHIVPAQSAKKDLLDALQELMEPRPLVPPMPSRKPGGGGPGGQGGGA